MPIVEPIVALHQPAAEPEQAEEAIELSFVPAEMELPAPAESLDLAAMSIRELKQVARDRKLPRYSSMTKPQLVAALS